MAKSKNSSQTLAGSRFNARLLWLVIILFIAALVVSIWAWQTKHVVKACSAASLSLEAGQQSGAAGTIYQHMKLTNSGNMSCTVGGFPTAFLYGSDGYALGSAAAAQSQVTPTVITLAPGEIAYTTLGYPQAGNFNPGVCSSNKSTTLKLYAPGSTTALEVPLEVAWCPGFSSTALQAGS
jgi:archaellum component FlaG (FlaF/FlaG flagellin family)